MPPCVAPASPFRVHLSGPLTLFSHPPILLLLFSAPPACAPAHWELEPQLPPASRAECAVGSSLTAAAAVRPAAALAAEWLEQLGDGDGRGRCVD